MEMQTFDSDYGLEVRIRRGRAERDEGLDDLFAVIEDKPTYTQDPIGSTRKRR